MICCFLKEARTLSHCVPVQEELQSSGEPRPASVTQHADGSESEVLSQGSTCGSEGGGHRWCEPQAATVQLFGFTTVLVHRGWTFFARFSGALWETFIDASGSLFLRISWKWRGLCSSCKVATSRGPREQKGLRTKCNPCDVAMEARD